ncbi:pirin family protein [Hydrocarboniphaga effusa]|uniref:pirin family protein n=1 Tax=Hydrocarboniphaga effusa TaxID=243629 RepID=UPI00398BF20C
MTTPRQLRQTIPGQPTSDGAGVKLSRSIGAMPGLRVDPFLMLDEFYTDQPSDYLAGFPAHPHRGFETVTYMLDGHMQHKDHLGNTGDLSPGDVQWMTAARGIIHSEMPQQTEGRMRGFQLWLNLPAAEKMKPASYRDIPSAQIPSAPLDGGGTARVIAGQLVQDTGVTVGPVSGGTTDPLYFDLHVDANAQVSVPVSSGHNAFVYLYEGSASIDERPIVLRGAALLSDGDALLVRAGESGARMLLIAGKPLHEPVVQYGPFVMNTREQIEQALADYQSGNFGRS